MGNKPVKEELQTRTFNVDQARVDIAKHVSMPPHLKALIEMSEIPRAACVALAIVMVQWEYATFCQCKYDTIAAGLKFEGMKFDDGTIIEEYWMNQRFIYWFAVLSRGQDRRLIEEVIKLAGSQSEAMKNNLLGGLGNNNVLGLEW